jgi:hypothetical protein
MASSAVPLPEPGREASRARAHKILSCGRYCTLAVVSEQPNRYSVTFYCDRCAQRWGYAPVLAVANREPWMVEGHWWLQVARRLPRRLPPELLPFPVKSHSGGAVPDQPKRAVVKRGRFALVRLSALEASAAQLICQKCKARPRVAVTKLIELAEQAMAASRHDAYA